MSGGMNNAALTLHELHRKWELTHYSRREREIRKRVIVAQGCQKITSYFIVLNKMERMIKENEELQKQFVKAMHDSFLMKNNDCKDVEVSFMLQLLLDSARKNAGRKTGGERYDDVIKELGHLLFHIGGLQLYEILSHNLPLPSAMTIRRFIYKHEIVTEGAFRIQLLKKFLVDRKYPLKVFLSEDATVVARRVQYHPASNQIVGFPLPFDSNGLPVVGAYPATSAKTISDYFSDNSPSSSAYCIVAQPLVPKAPTFVVNMFGTDNKFTADQVQKRWLWTIPAMAAEGIEVSGFAADGDSRLLKCMTYNMVTSSPDKYWPWFLAKRLMQFVCFQDSIHIGNKLKSLFLSPSIILPFGNLYVASRGHLVELIEKHQLKDQHLLCTSDLNAKDKMNHAAMLRMSNKKVTELLRQKVEGSLATALYLDMMREVVEAITSVSLTPLERVEMIWSWVFYLRIWRGEIMNSPDYTLESNFITRNAYQCIEINAHSLIGIMIKLRDSEDHNLFLPWLMTSQPCESTFRDLRSREVSFSILEMENSLRRSDTIASSRLNLEGKIVFPRHHKAILKSNAESHVPISLPEDYQIEQAVQSAFTKAMQRAVTVGLLKKTSSTGMPPSGLKHINASEMNLNIDFEDDDIDADVTEIIPDDNEDEDNADENEIISDLPDVMEDLLMVSSGSLGLKTFNDITITETCPFVIVCDGFKEPCIVRKSTLCWLLRSGNTKISADRLLRVQESSINDQRLMRHQDIKHPSKEAHVSVTDWCAFHSEDGSIAVGRILAFRYLSGTTRKNQVYSKLDAPTTPPEQNARGLGALCSWFKIQKNQILSPISMDVHGYYDLVHYICSIPRPKTVGKSLKMSCTTRAIKMFLD